MDDGMEYGPGFTMAASHMAVLRRGHPVKLVLSVSVQCFYYGMHSLPKGAPRSPLSQQYNKWHVVGGGGGGGR